MDALRPLNKRDVIDWIRSHLEEELKDNPGGEEAASLKRALLMYRFLPIREFSGDDVVAPAGLVELEFSGRTSWVLLVPQHGGLVTRFENQPLQVLTPQSPLGEAMLGKRAGDSFVVEAGKTQREYRIRRVL